MLFHLYPNFFKYGYLGVDLFFVLSGYLITKIIYSKLEQKKFSFFKFYRNRIRRIFPSVIIVLFFTILFGYLFLFPQELKNLGKHIQASAFFYQNFNLIHEVGYWDKAAQLKPLLHFWSLSVEEHFYIFWPFLIYMIYRFRFNLLYSLIFILILFFSLRYILDINLFYNSLARFWELTLGGVLFAIEKNFQISLPKKNFFLSNKFLVFFGLISFPLYLWHYVIISFMYIVGLNVIKYSLAILFFSIILAYFTYLYIEIPSRKQESYFFAGILVIMLLIIGIIGRYIYINDGLPNRSFLAKNKYQSQFIRPKPFNENGIILFEKILNKKPLNDYVKATSMKLDKSYVLVIGDSHAETSYYGISKLAKKYNLETLLIANSSCPPLINGEMGYHIKDLNLCRIKINDIFNIIKSNKIKIKKIIYITRGTVYMKDKGYGIIEHGGKKLNYHFKEYFVNKKANYNQELLYKKRLFDTFKFLNSLHKEVFFVLENPELGFDPKNCLERPFNIFPQQCKISYINFIKRQSDYRKYVFDLGKKFKHIYILDNSKLFCDNKNCYAIINGHMMYADDDHYSLDGSLLQAKFFEKYIFKR